MPGLCFDHVLPSLRSRPTRAPEFSRLSQHGITCMTMEYVPFETIFGPLALPLDLELRNFLESQLVFQFKTQLVFQGHGYSLHL